MQNLECKKIKKNKKGMFVRLILNYKIFLSFMMLFIVTGIVYNVLSYKNYFTSSCSIFYRSYSPDSYIEQMGYMANEEVVFANTCNDLKEKNVLLNNSLEYTSQDIRKITKIKTDIPNHMVSLSVNFTDKDKVQVVCEILLINTLSHIRSNPIFSSVVLVMSNASAPLKHNNSVLEKMLCFVIIGFVVGVINALIKSKYNEVVHSKSDLFESGVEYISVSLNNLLENVADEQNFSIVLYNDSVNIESIFSLISQIAKSEDILVICLCKSDNVLKNISTSDINNLQFISYDENNLDDIVVEIRKIQNKYEKIIFIIKNEIKVEESVLLFRESKHVILVKKNKTSFNGFINKYNNMIDNDVTPIILYRE